MWSLEAEVQRISGCATLQDALCALELADPEPGPSRLSIEREWWPSGAETYSTVFSVQQDGLGPRRYIWKAHISAGGGASARVDELISRRTHLAEVGVATPQLMFRDRADVCEEFIPFAFSDLVAAKGLSSTDLRQEASELIRRVVRAGYTPTSLHDLRSRGDDCVMIDFGSDLGPASPLAQASAEEIERAVARLEKTLGVEAYGEVQIHGT